MLKAETRPRRRGNLSLIVKSVGLALFMATAARAGIVTGASPFAVACFTAGLYAGADYRTMLVGCALGYAWETPSVGGFGALIGCCLVYMIWMATKVREGFRVTLPSFLTHWTNGLSDEVIASVTALIPAFAAGIIAGAGIVKSIVCAIAALSLTPVLMCLGNINRRRSALLAEERLALLAFAFIAVAGLANSPASFLVRPFAAFITLLCSYAGCAQGAAGGAIAGLAALVVTSDSTLIPALSLSGFVAGLTLPLGRGWSCAAFAVASAIGDLSSTDWNRTLTTVVGCATAGAVYALIREDDVERLSDWITGRTPEAYVDGLASRIGQAAVSRLVALERAFGTLADGYGETEPGQDEAAMTSRLRKTLCEGCPSYMSCWNGNDDRAGRLLCGFLANALKGDIMRETDELPPHIARDCRRAAIIPRKLAPELQRFCDERRRFLQNKTNAATLARHFSMARDVLSHAAKDLGEPAYVDYDMSREVLAALEREGYDDASVMVLSGNISEVSATRNGVWLEDDARTVQRIVSDTLSLSMRAVLSRGGEQTLRLVQSPVLQADVGYACRALSPAAPCGDSFLSTSLGAGRVLVALSDGMGSGERAAGESARTIELIRRFLHAGIDDKLALDAVNQLLLIRNEDEMFATADICVLDLNTSCARFIKQGACASYIVRDNIVTSVEGGKLPLGILDEVCPCLREAKLEAGDLIIMLTDGVCDGASDEDAEWINTTLPALCDKPSDDIPRELIKAAMARRDSTPDDMTAIAVRVKGCKA